MGTMDRAENLVIMFTDIVGFTELTASQSRAQNKRMLRQNEKLLGGAAKKFGGKRIKSIGDALLFVFRSPTDALLCAMAMHDLLWEYNQAFEDKARQISIRVAINSGEVRLDGGDVFGEPVNITSRLEGITPANEIYFTESIYLSMNKAEVSHELVDRFKLKGIPEEVTVYRVPRSTSAQRLVSYSDGEPEKSYPYGGAHHSERGSGVGISSLSFSSGSSFKKLAIGAALSVMISIAGIIMWSGAEKVEAVASIEPTQTEVLEPIPVVIEKPKEPEITPEELLGLLEDGNLVGLEARANEVLAKKPNDPLALFMQGHIKMERRQYREGIDAYTLAVEGNPELAQDERYARNVARLLTFDAGKVTKLAKLAPTEPLAVEIAKRTLVEEKRQLRLDAAYVLRQMKQSRKVDLVAMTLLDLKEAKSCEDKNAAIKILGEQQDPRALPALEKITKTNFIQRLKMGCLVKPAKAAVKSIEAKLAE